MSEHGNPILLPSLKSWGGDAWRKEAECKGLTTSEFFTVDPDKVRRIKKICDTCAVKNECLQFALTNDISWGIYGGMTSKERNKAFKHVVGKR